MRRASVCPYLALFSSNSLHRDSIYCYLYQTLFSAHKHASGTIVLRTQHEKPLVMDTLCNLSTCSAEGFSTLSTTTGAPTTIFNSVLNGSKKYLATSMNITKERSNTVATTQMKGYLPQIMVTGMVKNLDNLSLHFSPHLICL